MPPMKRRLAWPVGSLSMSQPGWQPKWIWPAGVLYPEAPPIDLTTPEPTKSPTAAPTDAPTAAAPTDAPTDDPTDVSLPALDTMDVLLEGFERAIEMRDRNMVYILRL